MKLASLFLALALSGCSSLPKLIEINKPTPAPAAQKPVQPVDENCAKLAKLAKEIATVRDAGVPQEDVQLLVTPTFDAPLDIMVREIYARKDITPTNGANNSYGVCTQAGYDTMLTALKKADEERQALEAQRLQDELAKKKSKKPAAKVKK